MKKKVYFLFILAAVVVFCLLGFTTYRKVQKYKDGEWQTTPIASSETADKKTLVYRDNNYHLDKASTFSNEFERLSVEQQTVKLASFNEGSSHYDLALKIKLNISDNSLLVSVDVTEIVENPLDGELIVVLYQKKNGINEIVDIFTCTALNEKVEGKLLFGNLELNNLEIKAMVWSAIDPLTPLSLPMVLKVHDAIYSVQTLEPINVDKHTATLRGQTLPDSGVLLNYSDYGFVLKDEDGNKREIRASYPIDKTTGIFTVDLFDLKDGVKYTYSATGIGCYAQSIEFVTPTDRPVVQTKEALIVTFDWDKWVVKFYGQVIDVKGLEIKRCGMEISDTDYFTYANKFDYDKSYSDPFYNFVVQCGVLPGKTIYYRAFVETDNGFGYGEVKSLTTEITSAKFTGDGTKKVSFDQVAWVAEIQYSTITSWGGEVAINYGFRYKVEDSEEWKYIYLEGSKGASRFSVSVSGKYLLLPAKKYNFQAFIANSAGMAFDDILVVQTPDITPIVASLDKNTIRATSVELSVDIKGTTITRGFEYKKEDGFLWIKVGMQEGFCEGEIYHFNLDKLLQQFLAMRELVIAMR